MNNDIAISVKNLSKRYFLQHPVQDEHGYQTNELWALKDVSFDIKKGESVGVIGPNGSGKSTLLKVLAGVTKPTSGSVEINGRVASILDIGAGFHPELSGKENVFLNGQLLGFQKQEIQAKFNEIVAFSGIDKFIDEPVKNYSNGMYLRLAFSILVNLDFDVYLFDEVMSVGDAEFMLKSKEKINQLASSNKTVIYVSHNIKELEQRDVFIELKYGCVSEKTRMTRILDEYLESAIKKDLNISVATNNIEITDFSRFPKSEDVIIHRVVFYQVEVEKAGVFCTNYSFILEVDFEKTNNNNTLDLGVNINDFSGGTVLSTGSFIKDEFSDVFEAGRFKKRCVFPSYLFNSQVYFLSLFFTKNLKHRIENSENAILSEDYFEGGLIPITYTLQDLIVFKGVLIKNNKKVDLSMVNLRGNLLPACDWTDM